MNLPAPILEALKEGARVVILGLVSWLLTVGVLDSIIGSLSGTYFDPTTKMILVGFITSILRSIDSWLHDMGKAKESITNEPSLMTAGLTRF